MAKITYAAVTHQGKVRGGNEDNFYVKGKYRQDVSQGIFEAQGTSSSPVFRAGVFDGMGGEAFGELASLYAVEEFERYERIHSTTHMSDDPMVFFDIVNKRICNKISAENKRMGTTAAVLELYDNKAVAINIGDSRIYLFREDRLTQISIDHTTVGHMLRMGKITREEAAIHKLRHQLTQHLGIFPEEMILEPAVCEPIVLRGGEIFLICSDGLTDMVSDEEIKEILAASGTLTAMTEELRDKALENGGKDNVTVLLISEAGEEAEKSEGQHEKLLFSKWIWLMCLLVVILLGAFIFHRTFTQKETIQKEIIYEESSILSDSAPDTL